MNCQPNDLAEVFDGPSGAIYTPPALLGCVVIVRSLEPGRPGFPEWRLDEPLTIPGIGMDARDSAGRYLPGDQPITFTHLPDSILRPIRPGRRPLAITTPAAIPAELIPA